MSRRPDSLLVALATATAAAMASLPADARACNESCAAIAAATPGAQDGRYVLTRDGRAIPVWCHDMAGTPREYLELRTGTNVNFSQFTGGGAIPGPNVRTSYQRVRLDPATLRVDINDRTFSTSTGAIWWGGWVTSIEYSTAFDCRFPGSRAGLANLDFTGTPFAIDDTFVTLGWRANGTVSVSADAKVANLTGGGYCGWTTAKNEPDFHPFGSGELWSLSLKYVGEASSPAEGVGECCPYGNEKVTAGACGCDTADVDGDGDGVLECFDGCPDTAAGARIDADGCSGAQLVAQACSAASFRNHGGFVSCVAHAANTARDAGLIDDAEHGALVSAAARSKPKK